MITEWAIGGGKMIIQAIMGLLDFLPDLPSSVVNVLDDFFDLLYGGVSVASIFIDLNMVKILIPFVIAIVNFDKIYKFVMWVVNKIPFLDID